MTGYNDRISYNAAIPYNGTMVVPITADRGRTSSARQVVWPPEQTYYPPAVSDAEMARIIIEGIKRRRHKEEEELIVVLDG